MRCFAFILAAANAIPSFGQCTMVGGGGGGLPESGFPEPEGFPEGFTGYPDSFPEVPEGGGGGFPESGFPESEGFPEGFTGYPDSFPEVPEYSTAVPVPNGCGPDQNPPIDVTTPQTVQSAEDPNNPGHYPGPVCQKWEFTAPGDDKVCVGDSSQSSCHFINLNRFFIT